MTTAHEASRTLVKSPPELWAECSDPGSLARHLGEFGEIKITRLEPETTVAWEGEHASGTVRIEPSGWGTRVTLTARRSPKHQTRAEEGPVPVDKPAVEAEPSGVEEIMQQAEVQLPDHNPPTAAEEADATVEEALEEPDPALASDSRRRRIRWRRVTGRMRGLFGPKKPEESPEPTVTEEPVGSSPPTVVAGDPIPMDEPESDPEREAPPEPESAEPESAELEPAEPESAESESAEPELDAEAVLSAALDSLGQAHHRPFSRA